MSYNGSGTFNINTAGQPVVTGTSISSSVFNALTADLATGLSTAITKDGQTATTARIPFAAGINSTLVTDSTSTTTGSIITAGGAGVAKALFVGTTANVAGAVTLQSTLGVTGITTFSAQPIFSSLTASSAVATDASKGLVSVTNTGTGNNVLATSPTLVTPVLGTPQSATLTNATGLPLSTGVTGVLLEANGGTGTTVGYNGFKNRIINGAMVIDQRNAGAAVTADGSYVVDRFVAVNSTDGTFSGQQVSDAPSGFINSLKWTTTAADTSLSAAQYASVRHYIEGLNVIDLNWGATAASAGKTAATVTLSFWVKSSLTGTFSGALANSAYDRSYPFNYTINSASTWEQKTITIAGDTSGTWLTTNGIGIRLYMSLGAGSNFTGTASVWNAAGYTASTTGTTSVIGTLNATWQITGVQLEKGSTATSFDYRPYGTELALCQRYYWKLKQNNTSNEFTFGIGAVGSSKDTFFIVNNPVQMRSAPTATQSGTVTINYNASAYTKTSIGGQYAGTITTRITWNDASLVAGGATWFDFASGASIEFSSEL
jgi:hypothetical protein